MKEYKFRGLNHNNIWIYGLPNFHATQGKNGVMWSGDANQYCYDFDIGSYQFDIDTLCEYTGLKDKNGKEIYEGDVVKCNRYKNAENYIVIIKDIRSLSPLLFGSSLNYREVIGNIYENPELLEQING